MRLIPVIDLLGGQVVHAVKGEREHYRPVKSVLCNASHPFALVRAFRDQLGLDEFYIADLDSIQSFSQTSHREVIAALASREKTNITLDAGSSDAGNARAWLDLGVRKVVIGSETLRSWDAVREIPDTIERDRLVFSLDFRAGKIQSRCPVLAAMPPMDVLEQLQSCGWQEVILLDLRRVGSGEGVDRALAAEARARFPGLSLLIGGGVANLGQLVELKSLGIAGVLLATAFHRGTITARHISSLGRDPK